MSLEDIQNSSDDRGIPIDQVGVSDLKYPIVVYDRQHDKQQTVVSISMSMSLPHHFDGDAHESFY